MVPAWALAAAKKAAQRKAARAATKTVRKFGAPLFFVAVIVIAGASIALWNFLGFSKDSTKTTTAATTVLSGALLAKQAAGTSSTAPTQYTCAANTGVVTSNAYEMPKGPATQYDAIFARAAAETPGSFDSTTLKAQAWAESGFNPNAKSPVGASGLIQFMPGTWAVHGIDGDGDGRADVFNPIDNIMSSAKYTAELGKSLAGIPGDPIAIKLAGYNAGPGNVIKYNGVPPFKETRGYIARIAAKVAEWGSSAAASSAACAQSIGVSGDWSKPITTCRKTSPYGPRGAVAGVHGARFHAGQDCGTPIGTPLFAAHAGTLTQKSDPGGYGTYYVLDAGNSVTIIYGHMSKLELPSGTVVQAGQRIGLSGNTGGSNGPHLHFEVRVNNKPTNPIEFMEEQGIEL